MGIFPPDPLINQANCLLFHIHVCRTQRGAGHNWTLAGQAASELHLQEHEPALLRLQAELSLRAGGWCVARCGLVGARMRASQRTQPLLISITSA